jgi:hypothetical protein
VARAEKKRNGCRFLINLTENLEDVGVDGKILKWVL